MGQILQTVKNKNQHYHIVYVNDQGVGRTSEAQGHTHQVQFQPPQPAQIDQDQMSPTFGQELFPSSPGGLMVSPGPDGHSHQLTDYIVNKKDEKEEDKKIIEDVIALFKQAKDREEASRKRGVDSNDFYSHRQWGENDRDKPTAPERAAVTINVMETKLDTLSGYQRQNRTDFRFFPMEDGDQRVADILNIIVKNVLDQCDYSREETKVFEDSSIVGRGVFNLYEDYETDIRGKIIVEKFKWDEIFFGPHEKEDLSDCDYLVKTKWYPLSKLKEMYPEKWEGFSPEDRESDTSSGPSEDWDKSHGKTTVTGYDSDLVNLSKKEYRLLEAWKKKYKRIKVLVNSEDGFVYSTEDWNSQDISSAKTIPGFRLISRETFEIRVSKVISGVLLEDEYPELAINDFHSVPVYCKYREGEFWSKIESAKDLQRLINKAFSLFSDIHNKMVAYGWFYDDQTFATPGEEKNFKNNSSSPGFTIKLNDATRPPQRVEGVKFPTELINGITVFNQYLREIMNVNIEMLGSNNNQNESGVAIRQKIVQQLLGNDFLFDNLSFAKKKVGRILVAMIQKLWTPERIMRVLANQNRKDQEGVQVAGKQLTEYNPKEIKDLLENSDLTKYDVTISESPSSPSAMMSNFMLLIEMAGKGVPIPPTAFFRFAPIPGKEKILEEIQAAEQAKQQAEQQKYGVEIQKTQIAAEAKKQGGPQPMQGAGPMRQNIPILPGGGPVQ